MIENGKQKQTVRLGFWFRHYRKFKKIIEKVKYTVKYARNIVLSASTLHSNVSTELQCKQMAAMNKIDLAGQIFNTDNGEKYDKNGYSLKYKGLASWIKITA